MGQTLASQKLVWLSPPSRECEEISLPSEKGASGPWTPGTGNEAGALAFQCGRRDP